MTLPKQGLHENVPFEEYLAWDAVSASKLSLFAKSPAHYQAGYKPTTKALNLGSVIHACVLEDGLEGRYAVVPNYHTMAENVDGKGKPSKSKATTWYKDKVKEFAHEQPSMVEIVSQETYDKAKGVVDAIQAHAEAKRLLHDGMVEVSLLWKDADTGLMCKGRVDLLAGDYFVDLKTTTSCSTFPNAIAKYGYHRQMAWYQHGLFLLTKETFSPYIVCCECDPPFGVMSAIMGESALSEGWNECEYLLDAIAACKFIDSWPGYESPDEWELPE